MTWYVCVGLMPWEYLGQAITPLFDAARLTNSRFLMVFLFIGTIFSTLASANGCINDASRAWFSWAATATCRSGSAPCIRNTARRSARSCSWCPVALIFALGAPLDQVDHLLDPVGPARLHLHVLQHDHVPAQVAARLDQRGYVHPFHPLPAVVLFVLCAVTYFAVFLGYGTQLVAMMVFYIVASALVRLPPLQVCPARGLVHHALAAAGGY